MDRPQLLKKIVEWLRAGYPNGVPQGDYIPLVALLRRQLSADELDQVTGDLIDDSLQALEPISKIDAGVRITKVTEELPHEADIARVRQLLIAAGWPFDDEPLADTLFPHRRPPDGDRPDPPPAATTGPESPQAQPLPAEPPQAEPPQAEPPPAGQHGAGVQDDETGDDS